MLLHAKKKKKILKLCAAQAIFYPLDKNVLIRNVYYATQLLFMSPKISGISAVERCLIYALL